MINIGDSSNNISSSDFVQLINSARKNNKNSWYIFSGLVDGKSVALKGFNTWLQVYRVNGLNQPSLMGISVKQFTEALKQPFIN